MVDTFPSAFLRLKLSFCCALLAALLVGTLDMSGEAKAADDTIVVARDMDINSLDPARAYCDTCQIYLSAVYQPLLTLAPDNKTIVPSLAEKWEVSPDVTTFTFHLNPAATFSDGSPVTGDDVKWSLKRLKNVKGSASYLMDSLKSIEVKDPHTVVITTKTPNSELLGILSAPYTAIINSKLASANGANAKDDAATSDTADAWFLSNSAGSGAFALDSYKPNDALRLKRNENYWGKKPAAALVVMKQTAGAVTQAQMLGSGTADIAMQVDPDTAKSINDPNIVFETIPSFNFVYLAFSPIAEGSPVPLTRDLREAIALAVDYKGAIDFTVGGDGKFQPAAIPNGFPGTASLPDPMTDVAKAKELMAKAGYADGLTLDLTFAAMNVYGIDLSLLAQKLEQDLAKINVKLVLKPATFNVWVTDIDKPVPFTIGFFAPDYFGSAQYAQYFGMIPDMPWGKRAGAGQAEGLDGKAELEMFNKALAATPAEQEQAYRALAMEMIGDKIIIPILSPNLVLAHRKEIGGVRYSACCNLPLAEIVKN